MKRTRTIALALAAGWLGSASALAGTTVYKCVKDGQTTLTDKPCPLDKPKESTESISIVPSSTEPSPVGHWFGQLQFQEAVSGQVVQAAHSVAETRVEFTPDGKVLGASPDNGCQVLGVWSQGNPRDLVWIDLTLDKCLVSDLSRRYYGSFILAK